MPDVALLLHLSELLGMSVDEMLGKESPIVAKYEPELVKKDFSKLMLRILVDSKDKDRVRVNLPLQIIKIALDAGFSPALSINREGKMASFTSAIDWKQIYSMIEQGLLGEIVSVDTAGGDNIRIIVE